MRRFPLALIGTTAATLLLAACQKQPEPAAEIAARPAPVATAEPAATKTVAAIDTKALPGTFSGTLPCASCPGIDTRLQLAADGTFELDEHFKEQADGDFSLSGTWSVEGEPASESLRLDPDSKSDDDRLYRLVSVDELRLLDTEGKDIDSALDYSLRRAPAADAPASE